MESLEKIDDEVYFFICRNSST